MWSHATVGAAFLVAMGQLPPVDLPHLPVGSQMFHMNSSTFCCQILVQTSTFSFISTFLLTPTSTKINCDSNSMISAPVPELHFKHCFYLFLKPVLILLCSYFVLISHAEVSAANPGGGVPVTQVVEMGIYFWN